MSLSRTNDDPCELWTELRTSTGPGTYQLSTPLKCDSAAPFISDPKLSVQGAQVSVCADRPQVDVDSDLMGITRRAVRCPQGKFRAGSGGCNLRHAKEDDRLDSLFESEATRTSNPTCTLRGTGWNRWESLCEDPQRFAEVPFEWFVNYRSVVKDAHRPLLPSLLNDPSLPPPAPMAAPVSRTKVMGLSDLPPQPMRPHWRTCTEIERIKGGPLHCRQ